MATLRNFRGVWYARSQWSSDGVKSEKLTALRTKSKVTAHERIAEVNKVEDDIKKGMEFDFPWMSDSTTTWVKRYSIQDAVNDWLSQRSADGIRQSTIKCNRYSLKSFMSYIGTSTPLSKVSTSRIDDYRKDCIHKEMKPDGININLRAIKTLLNWSHRRDLINKVPYVEMVSKPKELPQYIPDRVYDKLMELD